MDPLALLLLDVFTVLLELLDCTLTLLKHLELGQGLDGVRLRVPPGKEPLHPHGLPFET